MKNRNKEKKRYLALGDAYAARSLTRGAIEAVADKEAFFRMHREYFREVQRRVAACKACATQP